MPEKIDNTLKNLIDEYGRIQLENALLEYGLFPELVAPTPSGGKKLRDGDTFEFKDSKAWNDPVISSATGIVTWTATGGRMDHTLEITHADKTEQIHKFKGNTNVTLIFGTTFIWSEGSEII